MGRRRSAPAPQTPVDLQHIAEPLRGLAVPISSLVHDPHNARLHPEENAAAIEGSLKRYGQRQVITFNPRLGNRVVTGNERLRVARDVLHWTHIAAIAVEEDERSSIGYALADNRAAELATWNTQALEQAMRLGEATMNEQLDAMTVKLAEQMRITQPALEVSMRGQGGRRVSGNTATNNEPSTGEGVEMPARPAGSASVPNQRHLKIGTQEVPLTADEERVLLVRLQQYQQQYGTTFGFVASLLEGVENVGTADGAAELADTGELQPA